MSDSASTTRARRVLATAAAAAFAGASLTALTTAPAHAAGPFYATEITATLDPVGDPLCKVAADPHQRNASVPATAIVELVVEGPLTGQKACGRSKAYKIGTYWFAASASTDHRAPTYNRKDNQQVRVVARVKDGVAVADTVRDRKRTGKAMKKDEVGYHLDTKWTDGEIPNLLTTESASSGKVVFDGRGAEADPGIAAGSLVTVQFTLEDPTAD